MISKFGEINRKQCEIIKLKISFTQRVYKGMNIQSRNSTGNLEKQQAKSENQKSKLKSRKRYRNTDFDISRSIAPRKAKQGKFFNMASTSREQNMTQQITDLSGTIIRGTREHNTELNSGNVIGPGENNGMELDAEVRDLVADEALIVQRSLESKVRKMVQEEIIDIKKTIGGLAQNVQNLSQIVARNQTANNSNGDILGENVTLERDNSAMRRKNQNNIFQANAAGLNSYRTERPFSRAQNTAYNFNPDVSYPSNCSARNENTMRPGVTDGFDFRHIRIDKLGIIFDNKSISVNDFIFRLEHLKVHYNIPEREVVRDFHLILSDSVKDWYWSFIETHGVTEWPVLRLALMSQYQTPRSNFEIMRDLVERKQENSETIDAYFHVMNKLRSKLTQPIPEYDIIKIIKRNINMNIAKIVYPIAVSSVEQLRIECNEAERNFPRREYRNNMPPPKCSRYVNEIGFETSEIVNNNMSYPERVDVNALQFAQQQKQTVICWNCKVAGHVFMECPDEQRTLFCYKCGKPNVTTPKCPSCIQKNMRSGVGTSGDPRPMENPVANRK